MVATKEPDLPINVTVTQTQNGCAPGCMPRVWPVRAWEGFRAIKTLFAFPEAWFYDWRSYLPTIEKIMNLENFAKLRGLDHAYTSTNRAFLNHLLEGEQSAEVRNNILTKRLQFDTVPELYAEVERICSLLDCSKREFLEMAVCDGINKAQAVFLASFKDASGHDFMDVNGVEESK